MSNLRQILISLSLLFLRFSSTKAKLYWHTCPLSGQELVELAQNPENGEFYETGNSMRNDYRRLETDILADEMEGVPGEQIDAITPTSDSVQSFNMTSWEKFYGRSCICGEGNTYCLENFTHCASAADSYNDDSLPGCFVAKARTRLVRSLWPFICVWIGAMASFVVCTKTGRSIIDYLISCCFPRWNSYVVDRIIRNDPSRARTLFRRHWRARRRAMELQYQLARGQQDGTTGRQALELVEMDRRTITQLALKTRIYQRRLDDVRDDSGDEAAENEISCTICFASIDEGERVGSLACDHIFHVNCLKGWLKRRNICPLCQTSNIAKPIYADEETAPNTKEQSSGEHNGVSENEGDGLFTDQGALTRNEGDGLFIDNRD